MNRTETHKRLDELFNQYYNGEILGIDLQDKIKEILRMDKPKRTTRRQRIANARQIVSLYFIGLIHWFYLDTFGLDIGQLIECSFASLIVYLGCYFAVEIYFHWLKKPKRIMPEVDMTLTMNKPLGKHDMIGDGFKPLYFHPKQPQLKTNQYEPFDTTIHSKKAL